MEDSHGDCDEDKDGIIDCGDHHEYDMDDIGEDDVDFNKKVHVLKVQHNTSQFKFIGYVESQTNNFFKRSVLAHFT